MLTKRGDSELRSAEAGQSTFHNLSKFDISKEKADLALASQELRMHLPPTPDSSAWQRLGGQHTAEEIAQQPALWNALADSLELAQAALDGFLHAWLQQPGARVIFTGAGSSGFIADLVADHIGAQWPADVRALHTTSLLTHPQLYLQRDRPTLLVSFGRSGSSPESVAAVQLVRDSVDETRFLDITCNAEGELARLG